MPEDMTSAYGSVLPKINNPIAVSAGFDPALEALAPEHFDQRRREEWRHDHESLAGLEFLESLPDDGKRLFPVGEQCPGVEPLKIDASRCHERKMHAFR